MSWFKSQRNEKLESFTKYALMEIYIFKMTQMKF